MQNQAAQQSYCECVLTQPTGLPQRAAGITATSGGSSSDLTESSGNDDEGLVIYPNEGDEDL